MRKFSFLFALLCVSVMGWATKYCGEALSSTVGATTGQTVEFTASKTGELETTFSITSATSTIVGLFEAVLQNNGEGVLDGEWNNSSGWTQDGNTLSKVVTWTTYPTGNLQLHLVVRRDNSGGDSDIMGRTFTDIDVSAACGGGDPDPDPDPDPTPGINWGEIGWLTNASGNAAFTEKYKAVAGDPGPSNIDVIQNPGWATKPGLYMTFPSADFRNFSLPASCYDLQGAGVIFHMDAFTAQETKVHVNVGGTVRSFTIYYADGTAGPAEIYDINFALADNGSSSTASSGTAGLAIDGNDGTRWEGAATDDETWTLDMGQLRIFNTIKIYWENAYCTQFDLTYSNDGETWSSLYTETNLTSAGWQTIELGSNVTARYIKYHGTKRATGWGQSFYEFQVFLPGVSVLTSIDLTSPATIAQISGAGVALNVQPKDQNGQNMEAELSWEITPAAAGHMSGNTYIPDQVGNASIRAYNGSIYSAAVQIIGVPSANLALSTNISTDNKIVAQSAVDPNGSQYDAFFAVDGNIGSVWQGRPDGISGGDDQARTFDSWFVVDLGAFYNIDLVALHFEGACSELYHIDFSANNTDWNLGYNLVGAGGINARNDYWTELDNNTKVRYVRFWSTKAATEWGMKLFEFEVYGTEWASGDEQKPVMESASLVSSTTTSAVIAVEASDNDVVARYHVVDATNGIDANFTPSDGKITINGLTHNTAYNFTITAKDASNNESENSKAVAVTTPFDGSINLALNQPCEGGYYDNNPAESADKANDGNNGTSWVTYGDHAAALDWWVVDLGNVYNLTNITALWANDAYATQYILQARVDAPTAEEKADDAAWVTLANVTGVTAGEERSTDVSGVGRYVRFRALAHTGFFRMREFRVFGSGVASVDTEAPVMSSASLVSNTDSRAIIAVAATDDQGVANYHVVDAGHSIDAHLAAEGGNITVSGLAGSTTYTFTITAVDYFGNESANSKSVGVTTTAHLTAPAAACAAPTWPVKQVKALYSPTYGADYTHQDWGSGTVYTQEEYGKKYVTLPYDKGYFGADGFALNCLQMEKLHYDIWIADDATIRIVPIWGGAEQGITVNLAGQQWNSIDINLSEYTVIDNWSNIYQMKIDQAYDLTFWVANAYFYRTEPIVDNEPPTDVTASVTEESFNSVKITVQATDDNGAVNFSIRNGGAEVATGSAASGEPTTITVSDLASGKTYELNVIASDEAGNAAAPVAVSATTKALPSPAPLPEATGRVVVPVFSDALTGAPAIIHSGGWGEATIAQWFQLTSSDKVFYGQNFNYAGWHSFGNIDASNMQYIHLDIYSAELTKISVTPISPAVADEPNHEGEAEISLVPGAWTSVDVALSEFDGKDIDWSKVFQFKFFNPSVTGKDFFVDNVYFWSYGVLTTPEATGEETGGWATFASPIDVEVPAGLTVYSAAYSKTETEEILELTNAGSIIPANTGVLLRGAASASYVFTPATATAEDEAKFENNSLVGCAVRTDISSVAASNDIFCLRYSELYSQTGFFLYSGQYIPAGKAYLPLPKSSGPSGAPRHVRFVFNNEQTATGIGNVQGDNVPCTKVIENGQLFIRRGNAVYTIQGTRVQ